LKEMLEMKKITNLEALEYEGFAAATEKDEKKINEALAAELEIYYDDKTLRVYVNQDYYLADLKNAS